jgi:hypothetical protein
MSNASTAANPAVVAIIVLRETFRTRPTPYPSERQPGKRDVG